MGMSGHASGSAVIGVTIAMTALSAVVVFARLFARVAIVKNAGLDDGFIVGALLLSLATTVTMCLQVRWGMGQHIQSLGLHESIQSQKAFYVSVWVYNLAMSCTKFSILLQYLRIFPHHLFRISCFIMIGIVAIYTCWTVFSAIFACWPISYFWTQIVNPKGGHCLDRFAVWFANAGLNIATDFATGLLPLRVLKDLEMPKRQRIALMVVFGLGGFTCIVSILRLQSLYVISKAEDVTWENPLAAIWSNVEVNTGILCSCLPTLRSIVTRVFPRLLGTFRSAGSGDEAKQGPNDHTPSGSGSETQPQHSMGSTGGRSKMSFDALGRGLSGKNEPTQYSYIHSRIDGDSSEEIELSPFGPTTGDDGQIQVTTVVEQDVEKIGGPQESESNRGRVRPGRSDSESSLL